MYNSCQNKKQESPKESVKHYYAKVTYYSNGKVETIDSFYDGKLNGLSSFYSYSGKIRQMIIYKNDKRVKGRLFDTITGKLIGESWAIQIENNKDTIELGKPLEVYFHLPDTIHDANFITGYSDFSKDRILSVETYDGYFNKIGYDKYGSGKIKITPSQKGKFYFVIGVQSILRRPNGNPNQFFRDVDSFVVK
jgi:hypothetical protein